MYKVGSVLHVHVHTCLPRTLGVACSHAEHGTVRSNGTEINNIFSNSGNTYINDAWGTKIYTYSTIFRLATTMSCTCMCVLLYTNTCKLTQEHVHVYMCTQMHVYVFVINCISDSCMVSELMCILFMILHSAVISTSWLQVVCKDNNINNNRFK